VREDDLPADVLGRLGSLGGLLEQDTRVVFAYLFGSAARRELTPLSDVDVAVFLDNPSGSVRARLEILDSVSRWLRTDRVDLVVLNNAPVALAGRILHEREVLADRRPPVRHEFESLTLRMFHDFRYMEHAILEERFDGRP
jgi:predicted nucleotidyltransferase